MKITYLKHQEIDKFLWDRCVQESLNGIFYAYSFYLDQVCETWDALIANDYEAVMPIPKNTKFGITYSIQPFFCQQLGVFSCVDLDEKLVWRFLKEIPSEFKYVHLHLNSHVHFTSGFKSIFSKKNYRLSLASSYQSIQKKYNDNTKRNLKKAVKKNYHLINQVPVKATLDFYSKHKADASIGKKEITIFREICEDMNTRNLCLSVAVYDEKNEISAMSIYFKGPNYLVYMAGCSTDGGKKNGAMVFIMDEIIKNFSESSLILDFEGSEIDGIARYFKGFGAELVPYFVFHQNTLPWYVKWLKQ